MKNANSLVRKVFDFLFFSKNSSIIWFFVRIYVGWQWFLAGWEKLGANGWVGSSAGIAIQGFLNGSLAKTAGAHADVSMWYAWIITHIFIPCAPVLSYIITFGEIAVGIALILGIFTGVAASFGAFMNFNYLFAGTVSINPLLLLLELGIIKSKKISGWIGLDRFRKS